MRNGRIRLSLAALSVACAVLSGAAIAAEVVLESAFASGPGQVAAPVRQGEDDSDNPFIQDCEGHHSCGRPCEMCHWDNRGSQIVAARQAAESEAGAQAVAQWLSQRSARVWFRGVVQVAPRAGDIWLVGGKAIIAASLPVMVRDSDSAASGQMLEVRGIRQPDGTIAVRRAIVCSPDAPFCLRPLPATQAAASSQVDQSDRPDMPASMGRLVFLKAGCNGCHTVTGVSQGTVGPSLDRIVEEAERILQQDDYRASRGKAVTVREYILESIVDPNAYIVPQCPYAPCTGHLKPDNFGQLLTPDELNAVIDFLMSLSSGQNR